MFIQMQLNLKQIFNILVDYTMIAFKSGEFASTRGYLVTGKNGLFS